MSTLQGKAKEEFDHFMHGLIRRNPGQPEFHQAVAEVAESIIPYTLENPEYAKHNILERLTEPDRTISFRVVWVDDDGNYRVNRGYRVQFSNAIGPYKGGLRFHKSVNESILKFLGFEQIFKNSLTTLPLGGGKGGADFNPKGKSDTEIMRFCQAFMTCLYRYIGANMDVPAGDIGVGAREVSYMYGQYKRLTNEHTGVLTGKGLAYGGSLIRSEATGYGNVYFASEMLSHISDSLEGKNCLVSGSGNVAQFTAEKILHKGGKVLTMSDSSGFIYDKEGINEEKLSFIKDLKNVRRGRISEYADKFGAEFHEGKRPWGVNCDAAFPCATQNEIDGDDAKTLVKNGCKLVSEGANMPTTPEGIAAYQDAGIIYGPSKAANAGGVAVSGLEMTQNSMRISWTHDELDQKLQNIMKSIHSQCVKYGDDGSKVDYMKGANVAGFVKVADTLMAYGAV